MGTESFLMGCFVMGLVLKFDPKIECPFGGNWVIRVRFSAPLSREEAITKWDNFAKFLSSGFASDQK